MSFLALERAQLEGPGPGALRSRKSQSAWDEAPEAPQRQPQPRRQESPGRFGQEEAAEGGASGQGGREGSQEGRGYGGRKAGQRARDSWACRAHGGKEGWGEEKVIVVRL